MKLLTRAEELILLAILRLKDDAYCVPILDEIQKASTDKVWTLGGIYLPLHRLEERGLLSSYLGDPTSERGGKSKRFYSVTPDGIKALRQVKKMENTMWDGLTDLIIE